MNQVQVVALPQDAVLEASAEALQVSVVDVEDVALHDSGSNELASFKNGSSLEVDSRSS